MPIITLDQQRCEKCWAEVQEVLTRYTCMIVPVITIIGTQIAQAGVKVAPLPALPKDLHKIAPKNGG